MRKNHKDTGEIEGITRNDAINYAQPELEEIIEWIEDGPDKLHYDTTGEQVRDEGTPPEEPPPTAARLAEEASTSLVVYREEDIFSHRRMPKTVHWSVPWSDLMMTMFILFAVMYIYQSAKREFLFSEEKGSDFNLSIRSAAAILTCINNTTCVNMASEVRCHESKGNT